MRSRRSLAVVLAVVALVVTGLVWNASRPAPRTTRARATSEERESEEEGSEGEERGGENEAVEQAETTGERLEALRQAKAEGRFGRREAVVTAAAPGWAGE